MNYGGATPAQVLLGYIPRDMYLPDSEALEAHARALQKTPGPMENQLRLRMHSKHIIINTIVDGRIACANRTRTQTQPIMDMQIGMDVDIYKIPDRKNDSGRRSPGGLSHIMKDGSGKIVVHQGMPSLVPMKHLIRHVGFAVCARTTHIYSTELATPNQKVKYQNFKQLWSFFDLVEPATIGTRLSWVGFMMEGNIWFGCLKLNRLKTQEGL